MIKQMVRVYESYQKGNNTNYKPSNEQIMDRILTHLEIGGMLPPGISKPVGLTKFGKFLNKIGFNLQNRQTDEYYEWEKE